MPWPSLIPRFDSLAPLARFSARRTSLFFVAHLSFFEPMLVLVGFGWLFGRSIQRGLIWRLSC